MWKEKLRARHKFLVCKRIMKLGEVVLAHVIKWGIDFGVNFLVIK